MADEKNTTRFLGIDVMSRITSKDVALRTDGMVRLHLPQVVQQVRELHKRSKDVREKRKKPNSNDVGIYGRAGEQKWCTFALVTRCRSFADDPSQEKQGKKTKKKQKQSKPAAEQRKASLAKAEAGRPKEPLCDKDATCETATAARGNDDADRPAVVPVVTTAGREDSNEKEGQEENFESESREAEEQKEVTAAQKEEADSRPGMKEEPDDVDKLLNASTKELLAMEAEEMRKKYDSSVMLTVTDLKGEGAVAFITIEPHVVHEILAESSKALDVRTVLCLLDPFVHAPIYHNGKARTRLALNSASELLYVGQAPHMAPCTSSAGNKPCKTWVNRKKGRLCPKHTNASYLAVRRNRMTLNVDVGRGLGLQQEAPAERSSFLAAYRGRASLAIEAADAAAKGKGKRKKKETAVRLTGKKRLIDAISKTQDSAGKRNMLVCLGELPKDTPSCSRPTSIPLAKYSGPCGPSPRPLDASEVLESVRPAPTPEQAARRDALIRLVKRRKISVVKGNSK